MIVYLDTSALVKLVLDEPGSARAHATWDGAARVVTSLLTYAEARAALAAGRRAGRMNDEQLRWARRRLDRYVSDLDEVVLDEDLAREAGEVAETRRLRGADAVHLATAARVATQDLRLATWDRELARAATDARIEVVPASR